jgi:shikimate kinase
MSPGIAILLHGPSGVGKSTIGRLLLEKFCLNPNDLVNLDLGWGANLGSERLGPNPYDDLRTNDPVLVMELATGEPRGHPDRRGAIRNPEEWRKVLREEEKRLFPFFLWAEWTVIEQRVRSREKGEVYTSPSAARQWYALYEKRDKRVTFPLEAGIVECRVTTDRSAGEIVKEIINGLRDSESCACLRELLERTGNGI